ncbi:MAG TPA: hypothetical protein PLE30_05430 [Candidatus Kapabacteria bacterium]|nr:hypothetical protein [Candidatus Kapabacteria bacterium]
MTVNNSLYKSVLDKAAAIERDVIELAYAINIDELYQIKTRLISNVNSLEESVNLAISSKNRLDRIRSFVLITGKLLETRDYLQLLLKLRVNDTTNLLYRIDEFTDFLMVNSGSLS